MGKEKVVGNSVTAENPKYSQGVSSGRNLETVQVPYFTDNNKELS